MNLTLKTAVKGNYKNIIAAFDRKLFEALKPPFGEMEIVEFTGSKKGDKVHIKFHSPIKAEWISDIVEDKVTDEQAWFVDVGINLPWPLATWTHRHIVEKIDDQNSRIIDDITFTGSNFILTVFLFPAIFIGFYPRKKVYQEYFKKLV
jgi:ligand-binding SRPBCC domain-containing protein